MIEVNLSRFFTSHQILYIKKKVFIEPSVERCMNENLKKLYIETKFHLLP